MSEANKQTTGLISWVDLTVKDATAVRDFYAAVVGWTSSDVDMGHGYSDYNMLQPTGDMPVAGICHAHGANADLPSQWLIYITVDDLDQSMARCIELGGQVIAGPKAISEQSRYCVIHDPAGAVAALFQPTP